MTARPHANHQLLARLSALEEHVKTEFDVLRANVQEYRLICENRHLHALVTDKENLSEYEQRIAALEKENYNLKQQVESGQRMCKDLEEKLIRLEKIVEEIKGPMVDNNIEDEVNRTNRVVTENVVASVEQLFMLIRNGNEAEVKSIIPSRADVNVMDYKCRTPLHIAAQYGHAGICEYLLEQGADVNIWDNFESTPLHLAAEHGHKAICEFILDKGADIDIRDFQGETPLHLAVVTGHAAVCKYLLDKGACVNVTDYVGETPLHHAAVKGHRAICEYLLAKGADVNIKDAWGGSAPLRCAAEQGYSVISEYLLDKGANFNDKK